jgi:hypothetical protein
MARSPYTQYDRLLVMDLEPPPVVVQGTEGAPPYRARCIRAGDSPPLARGDTLVVTHVNPSSDLTVVERVTPGAKLAKITWLFVAFGDWRGLSYGATPVQA